MKLVAGGISKYLREDSEKYFSYCLMLLPSTLPISSASVVVNHKAADSFSGDKCLTNMLVSGESCKVSAFTASSAYKQRMTCLMHLVQVGENLIKYTTSVEHSFRRTNDPEERLIDTINQVSN